MADGERVLEVLNDTAEAIKAALAALEDWGIAGTRPGQYRSDIAADEAALPVLAAAGFGVLSEESGLHGGDRDVVVVLDPVDGSTNASRGLPWYATSACAVDADGALAAVVVNQATGTRFEAVRGQGARRDGAPIRPSACTVIGSGIVAMSGHPPHHLGWRQYRVLGAAALDLCAVASGMVDAYLDAGDDTHGPWDYLGGVLVCREAGAVVADAKGRDLVSLGHADRRTVVAAATPELFEQVRDARAGFLPKMT